MLLPFLHAVSSEWLKRRRSLTLWLVAGSALFIPAIIFLSRFRRVHDLPRLHADPQFWQRLWVQSWEAMALMILPMTIMLMTTLITQIEDRHQGWKQVHAAPLPFVTVFVAKLTIILGLVASVLVVFTAGIYVCGILPGVVLPEVSRPAARFPTQSFLRRDLDFLVDVLPIVAVQYGLALRFRTFLTPLGIGMALWILSVGTFGWTYNYTVPYSYAGLDYLMVEYRRPMPLPASTRAIAGGLFLVLTVMGYVLYARRSDKG